MARPIGPRKIYRYSDAFRATSVRLSDLTGVTGHPDHAHATAAALAPRPPSICRSWAGPSPTPSPSSCVTNTAHPSTATPKARPTSS